MPIEYTPIEGAAEFRLVVLSGASSGPLSCSLHLVSFTSEPLYQALSYTWGSIADGTRQILVDGNSVRVGINLHGALSALRYNEAGKDRTLWIDSLSINQADDSERSQQVQMMGKIYSHAKEVVICLGREADNSNLAMAAMKKISQITPTATDSAEKKLIATFKRHRAAWAAIGKLFGRDYWQRMWIIQEVQLASELVVCCGARMVSWKSLKDTLDLANQYLKCPVLSGEKVLLDVSTSLAARLESHHLKRQAQGSTLKELLYDSRKSKCSDKRDKIYALVGLARDCQHGQLPVDYSKTSGQVYKDVMKLYTRLRPGAWHPQTGMDPLDAVRFSSFLLDLLKSPELSLQITDSEPVIIVGYPLGEVNLDQPAIKVHMPVKASNGVFTTRDKTFACRFGFNKVPKMNDFAAIPSTRFQELENIEAIVTPTTHAHSAITTMNQAVIVPASTGSGDSIVGFVDHEMALVLRSERGEFSLVGSALLVKRQGDDISIPKFTIPSLSSNFSPPSTKQAWSIRINIVILQALTAGYVRSDQVKTCPVVEMITKTSQ